MRLVVLANPRAGSARGARTGERVAQRLRAAGHGAALVAADGVERARVELAGAVAAGARAVVAVGGDGTVPLALQAVAGTAVALGVVPTGTGNDVARGLGLLVRDPDEATTRLIAALERAPRVLDAVRLEGAAQGHAWCAGVLSAGFDAAVTQRAAGLRWPRGGARYALAVLLEVAGLRAWRYRIVQDGAAESLDAVLVTVGNTTSVGGGMRLLPAAQPDDGLLDVLVASPLRRRELLAIFPRVFSGRHVGDPHVRTTRAARVELAAGPGPHPPPQAFADGEPVGALPLALTCVPGALRVLC